MLPVTRTFKSEDLLFRPQETPLAEEKIAHSCDSTTTSHFSEMLTTLLGNQESIDKNGILKEVIGQQKFPDLNLKILCHLVDYLSAPRCFKHSQICYSLAELLLYLDECVPLSDIRIIGSQVLWLLSLGKTEDAYLRAILVAMGAKVQEGACLECIKTPFDLDLIFIYKNATFEQIRALQSKVEEFFSLKGIVDAADIQYLNPPRPFQYANTKVQTKEGVLDFTLSAVKNSEKLFVKDSLSLPLKDLLRALKTYKDPVLLKAALTQGKINIAIKPESSAPNLWQAFLEQFLNLLRLEDLEHTNDKAWGRLIGSFVKGARSFQEGIEDGLLQRLEKSLKNWKGLATKKTTDLPLPKLVIKHIEQKLNRAKEEVQLAYVLCYHLEKVSENHFEQPFALTTLGLQTSFLIKGCELFDENKKLALIKALWQELERFFRKKTFPDTKEEEDYWSLIAQVLGKKPALVEGVLALLEVKAFQLLAFSSSWNDPQAWLVMHQHRLHLSLKMDGLCLLLPFAPKEAMQSLLVAEKALAMSDKELLKSLDLAFPLINESDSFCLSKEKMIELLKIEDNLHIQALLKEHMLLLDNTDNNATCLLTQALAVKSIFICLALLPLEARELGLKWLEQNFLAQVKFFSAESLHALLEQLKILAGEQKNSPFTYLEFVPDMPFALLWAKALVQTSRPEHILAASKLWQQHALPPQTLQQQALTLSFFNHLVAARPDLAAKVLDSLMSTLSAEVSLACLKAYFEVLKNKRDTQSYQKEAYRSILELIKICRKSQVSESFLKLLDGFIVQLNSSDNETALKLALSINPKELAEKELAQGEMLWDTWIKIILLNDVKQAHAWWLSAKEAGWSHFADPLFLAEQTIEKNVLFFKELFKFSSQASLPAKAKLLKTYLQQALDHPINFSSKEKQLELLEIINTPLCASLLQQETSAIGQLLFQLIEKVFLPETRTVQWLKINQTEDLFSCLMLTWLMAKINKLPRTFNLADRAPWILKVLREAHLKEEQGAFWKEMRRRKISPTAQDILGEELQALLNNELLADCERTAIFFNYLPLLSAQLGNKQLTLHFNRLKDFQLKMPKNSLPIFLELLLSSSTVCIEAWQVWFESMQAVDEFSRETQLIDQIFSNHLLPALKHTEKNNEEAQVLAPIWTAAMRLLPLKSIELLYPLLNDLPVFLDVFKTETDRGQPTLLILFKLFAENLKNNADLKWGKRVFIARKVVGDFLSIPFGKQHHKQSKDKMAGPWNSIDQSLALAMKSCADFEIIERLINYHLETEDYLSAGLAIDELLKTPLDLQNPAKVELWMHKFLAHVNSKTLELARKFLKMPKMECLLASSATGSSQATG